MADAIRFALIDSAFGRYGLAWTPLGIRRVQLPESDDAETTRLTGRGAEPATPWGASAEAADLLGRYFSGDAVDFGAIPLDLEGVPEFHRAVYALARQLGWGEITTYGAIARALGGVGLSRAVGQALGANPVPILIPCHRVLAAGGSLGGFSAHGGRITKQRLLELERAPVQLALL